MHLELEVSLVALPAPAVVSTIALVLADHVAFVAVDPAAAAVHAVLVDLAPLHRLRLRLPHALGVFGAGVPALVGCSVPVYRVALAP